MRRLSVTLLATTIATLAAVQPSSAASPKTVSDENCAMAKGDAAIVIKTRLNLADAGFADLMPIPVYRIDRTHLLPRPELAMHRHPRPERAAAPVVESPVALAAKGKVPLRYNDNAKAKLVKRAGLAGGLEAPVAPVLTGLLLSAYA